MPKWDLIDEVRRTGQSDGRRRSVAKRKRVDDSCRHYYGITRLRADRGLVVSQPFRRRVYFSEKQTTDSKCIILCGYSKNVEERPLAGHAVVGIDVKRLSRGFLRSSTIIK